MNIKQLTLLAVAVLVGRITYFEGNVTVNGRTPHIRDTVSTTSKIIVKGNAFMEIKWSNGAKTRYESSVKGTTDKQQEGGIRREEVVDTTRNPHDLYWME